MEKEFQLDDYVLQIIEDLLIMCRENVALVGRENDTIVKAEELLISEGYWNGFAR